MIKQAPTDPSADYQRLSEYQSGKEVAKGNIARNQIDFNVEDAREGGRLISSAFLL